MALIFSFSSSLLNPTLIVICNSLFSIKDEISRVLLRILQANGKATEFLASIVLEEVTNLGKYTCFENALIML